MANLLTRVKDAITGETHRELAELKAQRTRPDMTEYGATGTATWGGMLAEEDYNADLEHETAMEVYDKMRRSDGQVKAALLQKKHGAVGAVGFLNRVFGAQHRVQ